MAITVIDTYSGTIPDVGQNQDDFNNNFQDLLNYILTFNTDFNTKIDDIEALYQIITNNINNSETSKDNALNSENIALVNKSKAETTSSMLYDGAINDGIIGLDKTYSSFKLNEVLSNFATKPAFTMEQSFVQELSSINGQITNFDKNVTYYITADSGTISNYDDLVGTFTYTGYNLPSTSNGTDFIRIIYKIGNGQSDEEAKEILVTYAPALLDISETDLEWDDSISSNTSGDFPAGLLFLGNNIGADFSNFDNGGRAFVFVGDKYSIGNNDASIDTDSSLAGSHSYAWHGNASTTASSTGTSSGGRQVLTTGSHSHICSLNNVSPARYNHLFSKNTKNKSFINDYFKTICFDEVGIIDSTIYSSEVISCSTAEGVGADTHSASSSYSGTHAHNNPDTSNNGSLYSNIASTGGNHTHTVTVNSFSITTVSLLCGFKEMVSQSSKTNMYALFDGATVPKGWELQDGANGTLSAKDKMLKQSAINLGTVDGTESGIADINITLNSNDFDHQHIGGSRPDGVATSDKLGAVYDLNYTRHSHTITTTGLDNTAVLYSYGVNLIKKIHL